MLTILSDPEDPAAGGGGVKHSTPAPYMYSPIDNTKVCARVASFVLVGGAGPRDNNNYKSSLME